MMDGNGNGGGDDGGSHFLSNDGGLVVVVVVCWRDGSINYECLRACRGGGGAAVSLPFSGDLPLYINNETFCGMPSAKAGGSIPSRC